MTVSIEEAIAQEAKKADYRKQYNQQPKVVERRKLYNTLRQEESKVARKVINKEITMEEGEALIVKLRERYEADLQGLNSPVAQAPEHANVEAGAAASSKSNKSKKTT